MRQDRDAGLAAIDAGVPKLTREQLSVLPMEQWEQDKAQFVYSAWARDAIADATAHHGAITASLPAH
jgi:hypothetical protein